MLSKSDFTKIFNSELKTHFYRAYLTRLFPTSTGGMHLYRVCQLTYSLITKKFIRKEIGIIGGRDSWFDLTILPEQANTYSDYKQAKNHVWLERTTLSTLLYLTSDCEPDASRLSLGANTDVFWASPATLKVRRLNRDPTAALFPEIRWDSVSPDYAVVLDYSGDGVISIPEALISAYVDPLVSVKLNGEAYADLLRVVENL